MKKAKPIKKRVNRVNQFSAASHSERFQIAAYGRRLTEIEDFVRVVTATKMLGDDDENTWGELRQQFSKLFFPALVADKRDVFKSLIAAMQWANINVRNLPAPKQSFAAKLRYHLTAMSSGTRSNPKARRKELKRRGIEADETDISRAVRQITIGK